MILLLVAAGFLVGIPMMISSDKHHTEWKKRNPNATWYPGTLGSWAGILILGAALSGFLFIGSQGGLSVVRMEVPCEDGTRAQTHIQEETSDMMKELRGKGCTWVDDKGNLIQFDKQTGETISVDPITGIKVEEEE